MARHCRGLAVSGVRILAPAKLNLGLAVLARRGDGYHEIDTIMAMIDLCDEIIVTQRPEPGIEITGMDDVPPEHNLIYRAAESWCTRTEVPLAHTFQVRKRIPSPGGLGGGSSDAAATFRALNALHGHPLTSEELQSLAAQLGADCPFFLGSPTARATGIGTELTPISSPHNAVAVIVPTVGIEAKTAKLYGSLQATDYGSTAEIDIVELSLQDDQWLAESALPNSFDRPVGNLMPEVKILQDSMLEHGIEASLTGAGPGQYALALSLDEALRVHKIIRDVVGANTFTCVASFLQSTPQPEFLP
ncbi:MAG: 4-(cytidine 5'-diphospho)-2-C-methyl-D-erythritol kinase [Thermomicrobiales bacterium]|nr:4-(cytidine 5'-diphospho)-2-C-methyl-D-erythritol kinase [Thermomicrobiales bacterium]